MSHVAGESQARTLSALNTMTIADLRTNRAAILEIAARNGARNLRIFGSVARGDATRSSDVDMLVEMEPGRSLLDLSGLVLDQEDLLGCHVDIVTEKTLHPRIKQRVLADAASL